MAFAVPPPSPIANGAQPVVSPRGDRIAFLSNRGGAEDLYVIAADGTGEKQLTHSRDTETAVQWSADGKQIVFSVFAEDSSRLHAIRPDGTREREIGRVPGRTPMLAPTGKRVVFMAGTWTATRLMVSALDGSDALQISDGSSIAWNNHWSPDGELAVQVNSRVQKASAHIWVVDIASGEARKLAAHDQPYLDETPSWFPDGTRLAFQSNRAGRTDVWVMNADGSGQRRLTGVTARP